MSDKKLSQRRKFGSNIVPLTVNKPKLNRTIDTKLKQYNIQLNNTKLGNLDYNLITNFMNSLTNDKIDRIFTPTNTQVLFILITYQQELFLNTDSYDNIYNQIINFENNNNEEFKKGGGLSSKYIGKNLTDKGYNVKLFLNHNINKSNISQNNIFNDDNKLTKFLKNKNDNVINELNKSSYDNLIIYVFGHCRVHATEGEGKFEWDEIGLPITPAIKGEMYNLELPSSNLAEIINRLNYQGKINMLMYNCYAAHSFCPSLLNKINKNVNMLCSKAQVDRIKDFESYQLSTNNFINNSVLFTKRNQTDQTAYEQKYLKYKAKYLTLKNTLI
jgi:hypothetical protein